MAHTGAQPPHSTAPSGDHGASVPPPMPWPGYGAPPPPPPPPRPPAKSSRRLVALLACFGLLGVACLGSAGYGVVKVLGDTTPAAEGRSGRTTTDTPPATGGPSDPANGPVSAAAGPPVGVSGTVPPGSKASSFQVRKEEDLDRLCERWFYPKSPKYTTAVAPHPIAISVKGRKDLEIRSTKSYVSLPYEATPDVKAAWEPKSPAAVQLVACVDLISTGPEVKSCRIDEPKPSSIPMKEGRYQLSLYEVATRRKLMQTRLTGEEETCPTFIFIGNDRAVYSGVEDAQLVDALRRYVEQ